MYFDRDKTEKMQPAPQPTVTVIPGSTVVPATQTVTVINPNLQPQTSHVCENYAVKQANVLGIMQVCYFSQQFQNGQSLCEV